jgi:hypothetical protein
MLFKADLKVSDRKTKPNGIARSTKFCDTNICWVCCGQSEAFPPYVWPGKLWKRLTMPRNTLKNNKYCFHNGFEGPIKMVPKFQKIAFFQPYGGLRECVCLSNFRKFTDIVTIFLSFLGLTSGRKASEWPQQTQPILVSRNFVGLAICWAWSIDLKI